MTKRKTTTAASKSGAAVNQKEGTTPNAADKAAADKAAADKAAADKAAADKAAADKAGSDNVPSDRDSRAAESEVVDAEIVDEPAVFEFQGDNYEITVKEFSFKGQKYSKSEALGHPDVLEVLVNTKSFILKKL